MRSLNEIRSGGLFLVKMILGGINSVRRINEIGLRSGEKVQVISNPGRGRIVIKIGNIKIGLGQGMAKKIMGEEIGKEE